MDPHVRLFDRIAPFYRLFFGVQARMYRRFFQRYGRSVPIPAGGRVLDVGCGTGALVCALRKLGYEAQGMDGAPRMARWARKLNGRNGSSFVIADALSALPFKDKSFDAVTASYVLHGLRTEARVNLLGEAARLAKSTVLIHDFSARPSCLIDFVERLEGSDYRRFVRYGRSEMEGVFTDVRVIDAGFGVAWYVCTP